MTDEEANLVLVEKSAACCLEKLADPGAIPEEGSFRPYRVTFRYRGSENEVMFRFEHQGGALRRLSLAAVRPGRDVMVSHYIMRGSNGEIAACLADKSRIPEWVESFRSLSASIDDKLD